MKQPVSRHSTEPAKLRHPSASARLLHHWKMAPPSVNNPDASSPAPHKTDQGLFCIWHGLNFGNWLRLMAMRPRWEWSKLPRLASVAACSVINSVDESLEQLLYGRAVAQTEIKEPPVFILGHWRSGTTLLHNLMSLDQQFTYPNLYQVMNPGHFLLTEDLVTRLTAKLIPPTRPMDNMPAAWTMTQEDEIAILLATGISPYWFILFSGDRSRYGRFFDLKEVTPDELRRWKDFLRLFIQKLTYKHRKPVVLKSPSHTYRIPLLLEMFPQAKFIYIYRDPLAVIKSSMHLRRTMFTENSFAPPDFREIEDDTLLTYEHCLQTYEQTKQLIPPGQLHEIRYEALEADPLGGMESLYRSLGFGGWEQMEPALRQQLPELSRYQKNRFTIDERLRRKIFERCRWVFEKYHYPSHLDDSQSTPHSLSAVG